MSNYINSPLDISKALDTTEATTGNVFVPEILSQGIRKYFEARTPVWNQIRKRSVDSQAIIIRSQTALPSAAFGAELAALPPASQSAWGERVIKLQSLYTRGELSGQLLEASRSVIDIMEEEIRNHTLAMIRRCESALLVGDSAVNPNEFDGINKQITTTVDGEAAALNLAMLEELLDTPQFDRPNVLFMNPATRRKLWAVLAPQVRFIGETEIDGGFKVKAYNDVPILEVAPAANTTENLDNIIIAANTDMMYIPVLKDLTYEELAHTRDSTDFIIKMYLGLVVEGPTTHHAKLTNFVLNEAAPVTP